MSITNELTNQIIDHIYRAGGYAWRSSSTGIYDTKRQFFRAASKKGVADILACWKGRLVAIEVKTGKDRLSPEQTGFLFNINHAGGIGFVARDFNNFLDQWEKIA